MNTTTRTIKLLLIVTVVCTLIASAFAADAPALKLPPYKKVALKNGMTVLLMEKHTVPLVSISYIVKSGAVADPDGKSGTAQVTASLLRKGTKTRTADQINQQLDFRGAQFNASANEDFSSGRAEFMKKDVATGMEIVADLLQNPVFPEAEFKKLIAQRIDSVKASKDQAQQVISLYYSAYLFGSHPYARPVGGDEKTLAALTRDDVINFHRNNYVPSNTIMAVVGDFNTAEMEKLINERFGAWTATGKPTQPKLAPAPALQGKRLLLIDKADSTQTYFMIGNVGVDRANPDRVGIDVVNTLFGGRFTSMINSALRIKSGLTYGARSGFEMMKVPGDFHIFSYTRNGATEKALDMTLDVIHQLHEKGITEEDLKSAKAYIKGSFAPDTLETSDQLAFQLTTIQFYGLTDAEVNEYLAKVDALTLPDAKRIIEKYFPEQNLTFVLIGKASEIGPKVKKYAPKVDQKSITEPGF